MDLTVRLRYLPVQNLDGPHSTWVTTQDLRLQRECLSHLCIHFPQVPAGTLRQEVVFVNNGPDLSRLVVNICMVKIGRSQVPRPQVLPSTPAPNSWPHRVLHAMILGLGTHSQLRFLRGQLDVHVAGRRCV